MKKVLVLLTVIISLGFSSTLNVDGALRVDGRITNVSAPINNTDAATKAYVDAAVLNAGKPTMVSARSASIMEWRQAVDWCRNLEEGGYTDWRLPTVEELVYVMCNVDSLSSESICCLWTATVGVVEHSWVRLIPSDGNWAGSYYSYNYYVRAVR